ncbi:MAG: 30S ribosomal protein S13, partial [Myxococcales bacterium]|nr:30S ribosomal protein S13 [Myxococcales bacterium]
MARIAGIDLPRSKRIEIALTYIYGIGRSSARIICEKADIDGDTKTDRLSDGEVVGLREIIEREFKVDGDLRR